MTEVDVSLTLSVHRHGGGDPTFRRERDTGAIWRTSLTPDGPGTIRVTPLGQAQAWGPGGQWLLDTLPDQLGVSDDGAIPPDAPILGEIARRVPGMRIGRTGRVFEALVPAVLEQKVVGKEAHRAWRRLVCAFGTPAPGPAPGGMFVPPPPKAWARVPSWEWHRAGVEGVRARTIMNAARVASRLEEIVTLYRQEGGHVEADQRLRSLPGIGPWTSAEVRQRACGDPDAISVGDYNLPKAVGWTLAGRRDADDDLMLELLAPYQGQRYRAQRLIELGGSAPPRHGPRMPVRDYRSI
jgi:hypothetical protein